MTDELQPMDLVVNAVLKAEMRKLRAALVYNSMEQFRTDLHRWCALVRNDASLLKPTFNPPKPTYKDAVSTMLQIHHGKLKSEQFQNSLSNCFKKVGLVPFNDLGAYHVYTPKKLGSLDPVKFESLNAEDSLAGWCVDVSTLRDSDYVDDEFAPLPTDIVSSTVVDLTAADIVTDAEISTGNNNEVGTAGDNTDKNIDDEEQDSSDDEDDEPPVPPTVTITAEALTVLANSGHERSKRQRNTCYNPHEPRSLQDRWAKNK